MINQKLLKKISPYFILLTIVACGESTTTPESHVGKQAKLNASLIAEVKKAQVDTAALATILEQGADINGFDENGYTAFNWAVLYGDEKVVDFLLSKDAKFDILNTYQLTPLMYASFLGHEKIVELLLKKGANPNTKGYRNITPLHFAAMGEHEQVIELLMDDTFNPISVQAFTKETIFVNWNDSAADELLWFRGNKDLIKKYNLNFDPDDESIFIKMTILMQTSLLTNDPVLVRFLIDQKGEDVNAQFSELANSPALHYAVANDNDQVVKVLIEKSAQIEQKDDYDNTAIFVAAEKGSVKSINILLAAGAEINGKNDGADSVLDVAIENSHFIAAEILLDKGVLFKKPQLIDVKFISAAKQNSLRFVKELLDSGANVDSVYYEKNTALHYAVKNENISMVVLLINKGASKNVKNNLNKSPFDFIDPFSPNKAKLEELLKP